MVGFVFYDTETTGLRPGWDQIVHFAAIRTDEHLNEIGRFEVRSRLQPHVAPHPKALLTNGLPIAQLADAGRPSHYEMVCDIRRQLVDWSPAVILGYNSIGFDEEMLRHAFFQSLHPPYLTSQHSNCRADVLSLVLGASALSGCLETPRSDSGRPVFRLERIASANGIPMTRAHDAMVDAEATLALCRLVQARSPEHWHRFVRFSKKATVAEFIAQEDGFVLTEFFGNEAYHRVVACIGAIPRNPNGRFCLDLGAPPERLAALDDAGLRAEIARKGSPLRRLAVNAAPTVTPLWEAPEEMLGAVDVDEAEQRARRVKEDRAFCERLIAAYTAGWDDRPAPRHPEDRLYHDGFACPEDERRMQAFHESGRRARCEIVAQFEDPRLQVFGARLIHSEHRAALDEGARRKGDIDLALRLLAERGGQLTLRQALTEVEALLEACEPDPLDLLPNYRAWLSGRITRAEAYLMEHAAGA